MFLICHLTSRKHIFKELREFMDDSFLRSVTTLPYLKTIVRIKYLICHVTKGSSNFKGGSCLSYVTILPSLKVNGTFSEGVIVLVCHVIFQDQVIKGSRDFCQVCRKDIIYWPLLSWFRRKRGRIFEVPQNVLWRPFRPS